MSQRRADADRMDFAVRVRRADDAHVELVGKVDIGGESAAAGNERPVFQPANGATDLFSLHARSRDLSIRITFEGFYFL
jgi:hypothetical protein